MKPDKSRYSSAKSLSSIDEASEEAVRSVSYVKSLRNAVDCVSHVASFQLHGYQVSIDFAKIAGMVYC